MRTGVHTNIISVSMQFLVEVFHKKPDLLVIEHKGTFLMEVGFFKGDFSTQ